jgi:hypothetical protein
MTTTSQSTFDFARNAHRFAMMIINHSGTLRLDVATRCPTLRQVGIRATKQNHYSNTSLFLFTSGLDLFGDLFGGGAVPPPPKAFKAVRKACVVFDSVVVPLTVLTIFVAL